MATHQLQNSRFELKYVIHELCARSVRDFLRGYLVVDEHADTSNGNQYPVHSMYLDNANYALYNSTVQGHKNRFKLRARFYNEHPDTPIFFEIKRRHNDVILKQRAGVKRSSIHKLMAGHFPQFSDLAKPGRDDFGALRNFTGLRNRLNANGKVLVSYMREAYVTEHDNSVRVTFDRNLQTAAYRGVFSLAGMAIRPVHTAGVVLEIKFTDAFPVWLREMVRVFDLERRPFAKYVTCVDSLHKYELMMSPSYQDVIG